MSAIASAVANSWYVVVENAVSTLSVSSGMSSTGAVTSSTFPGTPFFR
jgi:hypothetical protein